MLRGRPPASPPRCLRCDLTDPARLYAVGIVRHHRGSPGDRRYIRARLCGACAAELLALQARWAPIPRAVFDGAKVCSRCRRSQTLDAFPADRAASDGLSSWCRACHRWNSARWYARQRDKRAVSVGA